VPNPEWGPPPAGWNFGDNAARVITVKGHNGQVTFDGEFVTISRKGGLARMSVGKGDKRFPLSSIVAVQYKPPGAMVNGFISFTLPGGNEGRSKFGRQTTDAATDENSVIVRKSQDSEFKVLRDAIETALAVRSRPQPTVMHAAAPLDVADQLTRLAALRDQGILSEEEFAAQKSRLLA